MPNVAINDFKFGVDRRRPRVVGVPGTMWIGKNIHLSRGGDVERAKKFVPAFEGLSDTFGLGRVNDQLFVFGSEDIAAAIPAGVQYQRLQAPNGPAMVGVLHCNTFDRKNYVIAEYEDGNVYHFFNGTRVTELDAIADTNSDYTTLADYLARKVAGSSAVETAPFGNSFLIKAIEWGTPFTLNVADLDVGGTDDQTITVTTVQANVAEVTEVRATGTVTITGGTSGPGTNRIEQVAANGVPLMAVAVNWRTSHSATAAAVVAQINNQTSTHGYSAAAVGAVITITAEPGIGAAANGATVAIIVGGDVTANTVNMSGGVTAVEAVQQIEKITFGGTYEAEDRFDVEVNGVTYRATGRASGYGTSVFSYKEREYTTAGALWQYCKLADPTDWTDSNTATGAGAINIASAADTSERLTASAQYQNSVAIFSRKAISIYDIFANAENNLFQRSLDNSGTVSPTSVTRFSNNDVLYLDSMGVRSLRVREIDGGAYVDDIGSPIDPIVTEWMATLTGDVIERAVGIIEPIDGRYMLAIGERVYVLSYFPSSKISAWSWLEPGFQITDFARAGRQLFARDEDTIYLYGGQSGNEYPGANEQTPQVALPFVSARSPSTFKRWRSIDVACVGTWLVELLLDPTDESRKETVGRVTKTTFQLQDIASIGESPMFAPVLTCNSAGYASLSSFIAHYESTENESE